MAALGFSYRQTKVKMKGVICTLFALFALTYGMPQDGGLHIPEKCSDVLAVKVCDRLDRMATKLKLKSEEVTKAVIDAYKKGKTKSEEIYKAVKEFLVQQVLTKKCEDFTSVENCDKLRKLAADAKVQADKVQEFIVKQIAELKTKECEDFLEADQCKKLEDIAAKLKIKFDKLQDMIVDAYLDAKTKGTEMIKETYNKVKNYVMSTKCEDMFNPDLCVKFRKYAEKTKVALPKIMATAFDLVVKGVSITKDLVNKVFDIVDYFYDCVDIFDQSSCDRLQKWAAKLKVTAAEVEQAVRKYVRIAIDKGTSIYKTIKEFVKNKIICKFTSNCVNDEDMEDALDLHKRSVLDDFKEKMKKLIDEKFPNLEADMRAAVDKMINKAKSFWELMYNFAQKIKSTASQKWKEFLNKLMIESVL